MILNRIHGMFNIRNDCSTVLAVVLQLMLYSCVHFNALFIKDRAPCWNLWSQIGWGDQDRTCHWHFFQSYQLCFCNARMTAAETDMFIFPRFLSLPLTSICTHSYIKWSNLGIIQIARLSCKLRPQTFSSFKPKLWIFRGHYAREMMTKQPWLVFITDTDETMFNLQEPLNLLILFNIHVNAVKSPWYYRCTNKWQQSQVHPDSYMQSRQSLDVTRTSFDIFIFYFEQWIIRWGVGCTHQLDVGFLQVYSHRCTQYFLSRSRCPSHRPIYIFHAMCMD